MYVNVYATRCACLVRIKCLLDIGPGDLCLRLVGASLVSILCCFVFCFSLQGLKRSTPSIAPDTPSEWSMSSAIFRFFEYTCTMSVHENYLNSNCDNVSGKLIH